MEPVIAVTVYELSLWLHIAAAIVGFGATFAMTLLSPVAIGMDPIHIPYVHRVQVAIMRYLAFPGLLLIIATGVFQAIDGDWDFGAFWVSASLLIVLVLGVMQVGYFIPSDRRLESIAVADVKASGAGPVKLSEEYLSKARTVGMLGGSAGLLVLVTTYLMITKPGA